MTNREKIITEIANWLEGLDTSQLAQVVDDIFYECFSCKHCVYDTGKGWTCRIKDTCHNGIKKWLEQEQS